MERAAATLRLRAVLMALLLVGCGGVTSVDPSPPSGSGGNGAARGDGGAATGSGGSPTALPDCTNPVATGTACFDSFARCVGPCSNSWQMENVCRNGIWESVRVAACGPDASHAPQCRNSFSGGELTPCCPTGNLDCSGKPDGYPGFGCTPGDGSYCSCTCYGGTQSCGC